MSTITLSPAEASKDERAAILTRCWDGLICRHQAHRDLDKLKVRGDFQPTGQRLFVGFDYSRQEWVEFRP